MRQISKYLFSIVKYLLYGNGKFFNKLASQELLPEQVDGYFTKYNDKKIHDFFTINLNKIVSLIKEQDEVLDVGCGTGRYLHGLENGVKATFHGIDISKATIENYTSKLCTANVCVGDFIIKNPFDVKFDIIYSITILEYIPFFRLNKFLKNIYLALKPGGLFYIQFPNGKSWIDLYKNFGYTCYPSYIIENKLNELGFKIIESKLLDITLEDDWGHYILCEK